MEKHLDYLPRLVEKDVCVGTGHEILGVVEDVLSPCSTVQKGQMVLALSPMYIKLVVQSEFEQHSCVDSSKLDDQGGFAEFFVTHCAACFPIPCSSSKTLPRIQPTSLYFLAQPLATILHALDRLNDNLEGKSVAVIGQGLVKAVWHRHVVWCATQLGQMNHNTIHRQSVRLFQKLDVQNLQRPSHATICRSNGNPGERPRLPARSRGLIHSYCKLLSVPRAVRESTEL